MIFCYTTDLHGKVNKFETVFKFALEHNIKLLHLGADILPKGSGILKIQKNFIKNYLKTFYTRCKDNDIQVLTMFGNDDLYTRKEYFRKYAPLLDENPTIQHGYSFIGYPFVPDYPFGLKTACKIDYQGWTLNQNYLSNPVDVGKEGFFEIQNIKEYFYKKGTIKEDLEKLQVDSKTIAAIHSPPQGIDLDVCMDGRRVGSKSVRDWIEKTQPLLVLCGHIHESPKITGKWKNTLGKTIIIQPGQPEYETSLVYIEIEEDQVQAKLVLK